MNEVEILVRLNKLKRQIRHLDLKVMFEECYHSPRCLNPKSRLALICEAKIIQDSLISNSSLHSEWACLRRC